MGSMRLKTGHKVQTRFLDKATTNWAQDVSILSKRLTKGEAADLDREGLLRCVTRCRFLAVLADCEEFDEDSGRVVGMATLAVFPTPTGLHGVIRDFALIFPEFTHQGIEKAMVSCLVLEACELKLDTLFFDAAGASREVTQAFGECDFLQKDGHNFIKTL